MKLLIISDMPHYRTENGITGWGPTMEEINQLPRLFDEIVHIACLYPGEPPPSSSVYKSDSVRFIPIEPSGGDNLSGKIDVINHLPDYFRHVYHELRNTDAVFIRCPSNIGLLTIIILFFLGKPRYRWAKYAGNWKPEGRDDLSYQIQRWWLNSGLHRGAVTINGHWPEQPKYVYSFFNPSLHEQDLQDSQRILDEKNIFPPIKLLFVGRCETAKGAGRVINIARLLDKKGFPINLDIIGDGPERGQFEKIVRSSSLEEKIHFYGWLSPDNLLPFYRKAHFLLLPTVASEGWPKVVSEGMSNGVIPLVSAISSIPEILGICKCGIALDPFDEAAFVEEIIRYLTNTEKWKREVAYGVQAGHLFTYESYLSNLEKMFENQWGVSLC